MKDDRVKGVSDSEQKQPTSKDVKAALLFCLYRHQGSGSLIGQPIRTALGIGQYDNLTTEQLEIARRVKSQLSTNTDGWVSVEDRLPLKDDWVLVNYVLDGVGMASFNGEDLWLDWDGDLYGTPTHWQPLPAPPAISQDKGESV